MLKRVEILSDLKALNCGKLNVFLWDLPSDIIFSSSCVGHLVAGKSHAEVTGLFHQKPKTFPAGKSCIWVVSAVSTDGWA